MNEKLKSFGIYQFSSVQPQSAAAQVTAQLIWYFIEGYFNRKNDFPASTDGLVEYIVDFKEFDTPITFWKSKKSGRWWMQVQAKSGKKHQGHHLVPCSYNDYKQAVQGDLSDRLFQAYQRFL